MSLARKAYFEQNAAMTRRRKVQGIGIEIYQTQSNLSQAMSLERKANPQAQEPIAIGSVLCLPCY